MCITYATFITLHFKGTYQIEIFTRDKIHIWYQHGYGFLSIGLLKSLRL